MTIANWMAGHWQDVLLALVLGILVDILRLGSVIRGGLRHIDNKLSEHSTLRLTKRIAQLEKYRNTVNAYASSDKALYLSTLQLLLGILMFMCAGAIVSLLDLLSWISAPLRPNALNFFALDIGIFAIAIVLAVHGLRLASLDTRLKVTAMVEKLDSEIAVLKTKLDSRTHRPGILS